jgi:dTDP-glucose 4,6-dehydratase
MRRDKAINMNCAIAPSRILVTGGCGFIGSALIRHLVSACKLSIFNVDKLSYAGDLANVSEVVDNPLYDFQCVDVCDGRALNEIFEAFYPDAVVHLAAESHVDRSIDHPGDFIATNIVGTYTVLECALRFWQKLDTERQKRFRLLHVSTDEVYGSLPLDGGRFNETSPYAPNSPYAASKAAADHLVRAWWRTYRLPVIISNCSNNYGPHQFPEKLIPTAIIAALEDRPIPVYGTGANIRNWLYVDDHVRALLMILTRGAIGQTYAVGGNAEISNIELVRRICAALDELMPTSSSRRHADLITFVADRPGHDFRYAVDDRRLRSELGWMPVEDFPTGLRKTIVWYLQHREWWDRLRRERYDGRRLGRVNDIIA